MKESIQDAVRDPLLADMRELAGDAYRLGWERIFGPPSGPARCPLCGATDHETVRINDFPILVCPKAPKDPAITIINPGGWK